METKELIESMKEHGAANALAIGRLLREIQPLFRTFGGDEDVSKSNNPISHALKDGPLQFAGGVDVASVVVAILELSGHYDLLEACKEAKGFILGLEREGIVDNPEIFHTLRQAIAKAESN